MPPMINSKEAVGLILGVWCKWVPGPDTLEDVTMALIKRALADSGYIEAGGMSGFKLTPAGEALNPPRSVGG
jgi:hypothetical protein